MTISDPANLSSILLVDKGVGESSAKILARVKYLFKCKRAGHGGTLDPLASGVLPVFFEGATRFIQYVLKAKKTYTTVAHLGMATTTYDREGDPIYVCEKGETVSIPTLDQVKQCCSKYKGEIAQRPPLYSAKKIHGIPSYKYARLMSPSELMATKLAHQMVTIYGLQILSYTYPRLEIKITCSGGTYIRSLVHDIGLDLGIGAHIIELRRTGISLFSGKSYKFEELQSMTQSERAATLIRLNNIKFPLERYSITDDQLILLYQGKAVGNIPTQVKDKDVLLIDKHKSVVGIGTICNQELITKRLLPKWF